MSNTGREHGSSQLLVRIETDFEALARLIGDSLHDAAKRGTGRADRDRLVRAMEAAQRGAMLARKFSAAVDDSTTGDFI